MSPNNNSTKLLASDNDLTTMFPYLKRGSNSTNSTLSNLAEMFKSLYEVSKATFISDESYEVLDNDIVQTKSDLGDNIINMYNLLKANGVFFIFKFIFKYCLSKYVLICILNASLLSKTTYFSKKTVDFRRNSVRWQLAKQQLLAKRMELLRTINENQLPENSPENFQVEQIDIQLAELNELEQNQLNAERQESSRARDRTKYKRILGVLIHLFSVVSMIALWLYAEQVLFNDYLNEDVKVYRSKLSQFSDAVFFIINWLELCLSINTQFDLLPHRKTILKYDGYNTFDYSIILFAATGFFNPKLIKEHAVLFKFFVYNKLCYEIVTIILEVFNLKYLWLYCSFFLDISFSKWAFDIMRSGLISNAFNLLDPLTFVSSLEIFLLYLPTLISYGYAVICLISLLYVMISMGFKNLNTLNFFSVCKEFVYHVAASEPKDPNEASSIFYQISKMSFSKLVYKFMLFTMRDDSTSKSSSKDSTFFNVVKTTYDIEFSTINRRITKSKGLNKCLNKHPSSLNDVYLDHLLLNVLDDKTVDIDFLNENKVDVRHEEKPASRMNKILGLSKVSQITSVFNKKNVIESFKFIFNILLNNNDDLQQQESEIESKTDFAKYYKKFDVENIDADNYASILLSNNLFSDYNDVEEYEPHHEDILDSESDIDEIEDYETLQQEVDDLVPKFQDFVSEDLEQDKIQEFDLFTDLVKRQGIFYKLSEHFKLNHFTRSQYKKYLDDEVIRDVKHELKKRHDYYANLKDVYVPGQTEATFEDGDQDDDFTNDCVVCAENKRTIILWPCKCFAICDDCRITLSEKKFAHCPCCRTFIHGYSKVNNV